MPPEIFFPRNGILAWHPVARHLREDKLGLSFARQRGALDARGDILVFVDDDNVLAPDYLALVATIMRDASIGALGGAGIPIFEDGSPPPHFFNFATWLACGVQIASPGDLGKDLVDLTNLHHISLFGAGLGLRRADFLDLIALPHFPTLPDRKGNALSSGGDYEICHLIALKGKRLVSSSRLKFGHVIPSTRWDPVYLQRLSRDRGSLRSLRPM